MYVARAWTSLITNRRMPKITKWWNIKKHPYLHLWTLFTFTSALCLFSAWLLRTWCITVSKRNDRSFNIQLMHKRNALWGVSKFKLIMLQHVSVWSPSSGRAPYDLVKVTFVSHKVRQPVVFIIKLDWSVCTVWHNYMMVEIKLAWSVYTCLTQLYNGRDMYTIYYIKNNYMFRHFTLAIFRLRNKHAKMFPHARQSCFSAGSLPFSIVCR